jgi:hypothetical protein
MFSIISDMTGIRMDRNSFKGQTFSQAADHREVYMRMSWQERLQTACFLIAAAYGFDPEKPPVVDRTAFTARSMRS